MPLETPPTLGSQYLDHRNDAEGDAAYAQEMARVQNAQNVPRGTSDQRASPAQPAPAASPAPTPNPAAEQLPYNPSTGDRVNPVNPSLGPKVAWDVSKGLTVEMPRAIYTGVHSAVQSVLDGAHSLNSWVNEKTDWPDIYLDTRAGHPLLSIQSAASMKAMDTGPVQLPGKVADPSTVTGTIVKNGVQFTTGMLIGGQEMKALGLPAQAAGWAGRGLTAAKAFLGQFQVFDGAQHRLSDLVQSVPALRNPITDFLSSKPGDNDAVGRLKSAVEGTVLGQVADGVVHGLRMLRSAAAAQEGAQAIVEAHEARPPPPVSAGVSVLGDVNAKPEAPLTEIVTKEDAAAQKLAAAAKVTEGTTPEQVMGKPARVESPVTQKFADELSADHEGAKARYAELPDSQGGKVLNVDTARELSPDYAASKASRSALAADVHEPASAFVKQMYAEKLAEAPKEGEAPQVLFTAGGTGAGKSTAIASIPEVADAADKSQLVYDTNMNNFESSKTKIDQALAANKDVRIAYVYRDPEEALVNGALPRAERMGRTVPLEAHAETHAGSFETIQKLQETYKDNPYVKFDIIDNSNGRGNAKLSSMEELADKRYTVPVTELQNAVEREHEAGNISERVRSGTLGEAANAGRASESESLQRGDRAGAGEEPQPQRDGEQPVAAKEPGVYVNFARLDTTDDLKKAMGELADRFGDDINSARRGVQTFEQTKLGAKSVDAWNTLMERRTGEPLNDVQSLAARQLWASSAAKTMELAQVATETPSPENLFAFRRMLETHQAIQQEVISARTETARALSSWRIPAGEDAARLQSITQQLASQGNLGGGMDTAYALAQRVRALSIAGDIPNLGAFAEKSAYAKTRDAVLEAWTNMLVSSPMTHSKVMLSNAATVGLRIAERATAAQIDHLMGSDGVALGEASAQYAGLMGGIKDSLRYIGKAANAFLNEEPMPPLENDPFSNAVKSAQTGEYTLEREGMTEGARQGEKLIWVGGPKAATQSPEYMQNAGALSSEALGMADTGWLGKGIDLAGQIMRIPGRSLTGEHDYFRSMGYLMEKNALAVRQATADVAAGRITEDAMASRVAELVANPPPDLHIGAVNGALYQTFTDAPGKMAELVGQIRNSFPETRAILPFYKIPSRILSFTFERSPLAPLMSTFRENYQAGGARQSLALAQMGLGSMAMMAAADAVLSGQATGSGPIEHGQRAAMENEGWQPYSMKVGGKWVQYNRLETIGSSMAMAADATEAIRNFQTGVNADDPDVTNLALATTMAIAQDITSKSYLQGLSNFFDTLSDPKQQAGRFADSLAGSAVPAGISMVDHQTDPYKRTVYSMISALQSRTPGASESLPPVRNLWGEPVKNASGMGHAYDAFVPFATHEAANEPIDKELLRMGVNVSKVPARVSFDGVQMDLSKNPKLYSRYQQLAGNEYKDSAMGGLGLKDALNQIVTGQHPFSAMYQYMPDGSGSGEEQGTKGTMIKDIVNEYRHGAAQQLLDENPALRNQVDNKRTALQQHMTERASQ